MAKRSKTEARLQAELRASFKHFFPKDYWYKIPDTPKMKGSNLRFIPRKPFDIVCSVSKIFFAIETKVHKKTTAFPLNEVHEHQEVGLDEADGFVWLNIRRGLGKARVNFIVVIAISEWMALKAKILKSGRKSIPLAFFEKYDKIKWKDGKWQIEDFFNEQVKKIYKEHAK